jgi:hypothetical protein
MKITHNVALNFYPIFIPLNQDFREILNFGIKVTAHRRDAENAKERWIFLSVDPLESEADMKGRKEKI